MCFFFFQAEDGIRDLVRSRGLGDVYKRQTHSDLVLRVLGAVDGSRVLGVTLNTAAPIPSTEVLSLIHI